MLIYLVRHGETVFNQQKKFYGEKDISLNRVGRLQSMQIAEKLRSTSFDQVYVTGLKRTMETASLITKNCDCTVLPAFNEKSFGLWEGLSADEIEASYPEEWLIWLENPFDVTPPEAETFSAFKARVLEGIIEIEKSFSSNGWENLLIVAHLGTLRILDQYFNDSSTNFWSIDYKQGTYTLYEYKNQCYQLLGRGK